MEQKILSALCNSRIKKEKRLRIWSAGCSSGEEPYSIAIALHRVIPDIKNWDISILATDINTRVLKKAIKGIYNKNAFRNAPDWLKEKYFIPREGGKLEILPSIRKMLNITYLNLVDGVFPSLLTHTNAMDIIFCRNVLMYFTEEHTNQIVHNLYNSLANDGWLIVSSSELSQQVFSQFTTVNFTGAIVYLKEHQKSQKPKAVHIPKVAGSKDVTHLPLKPTLTAEEIRPPRPVFKKESSKVPGTLIPEQSEETILWIKSLANQGKLEEAAAKCQKAIVSDKLNPGLHFLFASVLHELDQVSKAIISLKHVIYLDPAFVVAYYSLGNLYLQQGEIAMAKKGFENVLSLLKKYNQDDILPYFEGMTAGRLNEIINATIKTRIAV